MTIDEFYKNILNDTRIELTEEFDRNFERKAFFDKAWPTTKLINRRGAMMARTNKLRRGYRSRLEGEKIAFSNSMAYASIHNEGGEVKVTEKMKRYFWVMYYETSGAIKKTKSGKQSKSKKNTGLSIEAQQFKALALMKVGKVIKIPERRVIGDHPRIRDVVENVVNNNLTDLNQILRNNLRQR